MNENLQKQGMKYATYEGILASAMFAITSTFLTLFALHLGADNTTIGLVISIPASLTLLIYIPAAYVIEKTSKRRLIGAFSAFISRSLWIIVALLPFLFGESLIWLILILSLSSAIGGFISPAWASMMGDIVPESTRGRYFAKRNILCALSTMITVTSAGIILDFIGNDLGFTLLFILAGILGILSSLMLFKFPDIETKTAILQNIGEETKKIIKNNLFVRFLIIFFIWQFGVSMASPFFNVHLVKNLQAGYIWVSIFSFVSTMSGIIINKFWGNISDTFGHRIVIVISAFGASFVPFFWFFATSPYYLLPVAIIAGSAWAGMNLANLNYLLDISKEGRRSLYSAFYWTILGVPMIASPIIGGIIADYSSKLPVFGGLKLIFIISWIIRLLGFALFLKFLKDVPPRETKPTRYVIQEIINMGVSYFSTPFIIIRKSSYNIRKRVLLSLHKTINVLKKWKLPKDIESDLITIEKEIKKIENGEVRDAEKRMLKIRIKFTKLKEKLKKVRKSTSHP